MQPSEKLVLCIDDEPALSQMLKTTLEVHGFAALTSHNRSEALQIARHNLLDGVILDYSMPDGNGAELAVEVKRLCPLTPILMFSVTSVSLESLFAVDAFVSKQEGTAVLVSVLQRLLACSPATRPVARKSVRYPMSASLVLTVHRSDGIRVLQGVSTDIGEGGLGGRMEGDLVPGELVDVHIFDPELESFSPRAQIRHCEHNLCGLEFVQLNSVQKTMLRHTLLSLPARQAVWA
jgi:CheY-like chemotaxis protein